MKVEPRGKYAGVKIHLDAVETKILMDAVKGLGSDEEIEHASYWTFLDELREEVRMLYSEVGERLLMDKTKEEIAAAHKNELHKASKGLKKLKAQGVSV